MDENPTDPIVRTQLPIINGCGHCAAIRAELERCQPLGPGGWSGRVPIWQYETIVSTSHPLAAKMFESVDACDCECHDIWRFMQRGGDQWSS